MANKVLYGIRPRYRLFKVIEYMYAKEGRPPLYPEIREAVKGKMGDYPKHLKKLKEEGLITYKTKTVVDYASIRLTGKRLEDMDLEE